MKTIVVRERKNFHVKSFERPANSGAVIDNKKAGSQEELNKLSVLILTLDLAENLAIDSIVI